MDGLPMVSDSARILANEIVRHFQGAGRTGFGIILEHFAPTGDAGIGRNLDEDPAVLQDEALNLCYLDVVVRPNCGGVCSDGVKGVEGEQGRGPVDERPKKCTAIRLCGVHNRYPTGFAERWQADRDRNVRVSIDRVDMIVMGRVGCLTWSRSVSLHACGMLGITVE